MKKNLLLSAVLVALVVTGCGRQYIMDRPDMYLAPALEQLPEKMTAVIYAVNPILDLSEGGDGRFAWTAIMWDKDGQETNLLALNLNQFTGDKRFLVVIPKPLSEVAGSRLAVFDHGGKRIYNQTSEFRLLDKPSRKVKAEDFKDFLPELNSGCEFVKELDRGSAEFQSIAELYKEFRIKDLEVARKYVYERYGSNLTSEQLDQLVKDDSILHGFVDWLGRDWKVFLMYPFMGVESSLLTVGVVKVFTLPSIWGDRIDRPGYMEYKPDAEFAAKMVLRAMEEYGGKGKQTDIIEENLPAMSSGSEASQSSRLPDSVKAAIKGTPCESSETYEEYNKCAAEYNAAIK